MVCRRLSGLLLVWAILNLKPFLAATVMKTYVLYFRRMLGEVDLLGVTQCLFAMAPGLDGHDITFYRRAYL